MNTLYRFWVWIRRIGHCRGFGIQSPNDYWFVRYVINEHWPYYQYKELGHEDDWLAQKLGRLYFRLANWRQPYVVVDAGASPYWQAGCHRAEVKARADAPIELMKLCAGQTDCRQRVDEAMTLADSQTVIVIEHLFRNQQLWHDIVADSRVRVSFDLYYCGILFFDHKREKRNYIVNF